MGDTLGTMSRRLSLFLAAASAGLLAATAAAAEPPPIEVHGAYCTPAGCAGAQGGAAAQAAAFGLTVGVVLRVGRRRRALRP